MIDVHVVGSRARGADAGAIVAIPVRTRVIAAGDDIAQIVAEAVAGIAREGDVVAVSETAVAIAQGRIVAAELIRPSKLAYVLSRRTDPLATVNQPESLQVVIDRVGVARVLFAAVAQVFGRLVGRPGMFYRVLGEAISTIDGYTGTMPPYERSIVLGPDDPGGVAEAIAAHTGFAVAVVDANDRSGAKVLGASSGVARDAIARALNRNPAGNGDEQTPIVVLKWRAAGQNPWFLG